MTLEANFLVRKLHTPFKTSSLILHPLIILAFFGCSSPSTPVSLAGKTMGTTYNIRYLSQHKSDTQALQSEIDALLAKVNQQMSTYQSDSEITKVNKAKANQAITISPWFAEVLQYSLKLAQETDSAFDPTIGPLVNAWGFGPKKDRSPPSQEQLSALKPVVGFDKVSLKKAGTNPDWAVTKAHNATYIDLSASAKGFAVDQVSDFLKRKGYTNHLVEIGGEIKVSGKKGGNQGWTLAIEKPQREGRGIQQTFSLNDMSLATSGNYRNFYDHGKTTYSHTIDMKTFKPVTHSLLSVSVVDKSCMKADALATALMAMGPTRAWEYAQKQNLPVFMIIEDNDILAIKSTDAFKHVTGLN